MFHVKHNNKYNILHVHIGDHTRTRTRTRRRRRRRTPRPPRPPRPPPWTRRQAGRRAQAGRQAGRRAGVQATGRPPAATGIQAGGRTSRPSGEQVDDKKALYIGRLFICVWFLSIYIEGKEKNYLVDTHAKVTIIESARAMMPEKCYCRERKKKK